MTKKEGKTHEKNNNWGKEGRRKEVAKMAILEQKCCDQGP